MSLKVSRLLKDLSDLDEYSIDLFFKCINSGFVHKWDCDLLYGLKNFGAKEMQLALRSAVPVAEIVEINRRWA